MIPGLTTVLSTVLNQVSDNDAIKFLMEMENLIDVILTECNDVVVNSADLDMQDKNQELKPGDILDGKYLIQEKLSK